RKKPQHAVNARATRRDERTVALRDHVAMSMQDRRAQCDASRAAFAHAQALHVGSVGEVEHHGTRFRKAVMTENRSETTSGRKASTIRPWRIIVNTPKSGLNTIAIRKSTSRVAAAASPASLPVDEPPSGLVKNATSMISKPTASA